MKKCICKIFIFVIFIFILCQPKSIAASLSFLDDETLIIYNTGLVSKWVNGFKDENVIEVLKQQYGYSYDKLTDPLRIKTKVTIEEVRHRAEFEIFGVVVGGGKELYAVSLGKTLIEPFLTKKGTVLTVDGTQAFSKDELTEIFGYEEGMGELKKGLSWDVVVEAKPDAVEEAGIIPKEFTIRATRLWSGKNAEGMTDAPPEDAEDTSMNVDSFGDTVDKMQQIMEFLSHIVETLVTNFLNTLLTVGDTIQMLCNAIQSSTDEEAAMFSTEDIQFEINQKIKNEEQDTAFDDPYNLNSYVNYWEQEPSEEDSSEIPAEAKSDVEYVKVIPALDEDEKITNGFTINTPIPVIRTDIYTLATDKVDFIKSNFLVKDDTEGIVWLTIRNFVASIIHVIIYFVAALLLLSLIWHGVGLAKCSIIGSPEEKTKHIDAVRKLEIAFVLLVGTLFIEATCLYLSQSIFDDMDIAGKGHKYEGPIRVVVHLDKPKQNDAAPLGEGEGFDISYHQGKDTVVDAIKKSGADFVILRAGITYNSGKRAVDTQFNNYYNKAKSLGLGVGAYYYTHATSYEQGRDEANFIIENALSGKQFEYPIYIDMEEKIHKNSAYKNRNTQAIIGFCETMKANGYCPGIYSSDSFYISYMNLSQIEQYELWVANWSSKPKRVKDYGMWQKTSRRRISGFGGFLDEDEAFKDYPSYMQSEGLNGYSGGGSSPEWSTAPSKVPDDTIDTETNSIITEENYPRMYSFSTTPTGYVRYMAGLDNIYLYGKKAQYTFVYIGLVIANFIATVSMILRMFMLMFLAVIGFIIIVKYVLKSKDASIKGYVAWVKLYAGLASIQVIFAIVARLLLMAILPKG